MYPDNWFALSMLQHAMTYKALEESFDSLSSLPILQDKENEYYDANPVNFAPWRTAVQLMVMFLMSRALQVLCHGTNYCEIFLTLYKLDTFAKSKQLLITERYGDLRLQMIPVSYLI